MSKAIVLLGSLAVMLLVGLASACGGGGSSGESSGATTETTSTETTATETTSTAAGKNERLTEAQWKQYQAVAAPLTKANATATARLAKCPAPAPTQSIAPFEKCLGDSLTTLQAATQAAGKTLAGFTGTVTGACAASLDALLNYAQPYQASVAALQRAIDSRNLSGITSSVGNVQSAQKGGKTERAAFERDCRPA
jgi:hypothetical protein